MERIFDSYLRYHFSQSGKFLFLLIRCYPKHRIFLFKTFYLALRMEEYSMYTQQEKDERFEEVCQRIEQGEPLRRIVRGVDAPLSQPIFYELLNSDPDKVARYTRAREVFADVVFDEILDIADESKADIVGVDKFGKPIVDGEAIQRSKLKVDTRKWMLSKLQPKKYGDRLEVDQKTEATITWKEEKTYQQKDEAND